MRATWLALLLLLGLSLPTAAQGPTPVGTTQGRVLLTLHDASGQPVSGEEARFVGEQQNVLATCTTDGAGRCTLELPTAPADASGFIRGAVEVEGRGRKPVIWPGGDFPLTVTLDAAGQLDVPLDVYATRTPAPTSIYPTVTPRGAATATAQASTAPAPAPAELATATVTVPASTTAVPPDDDADSPSPFTTLLVILIFAALGVGVMYPQLIPLPASLNRYRPLILMVLFLVAMVVLTVIAVL